MEQIIKSVCACVCVYLSVRLRALSRSHFFGTDVRTTNHQK